MNEPLISVIIPARSAKEMLFVALDSIRNQTYKNLEIIVVDDGDGSLSDALHTVVAQDARVRAIPAGFDDPARFDAKLQRNINAGYSARNAGLAVARGELITFQDADDASFLNRIEVQYKLLTEYNAMHILTDCTSFDETKVGDVFDVQRYTEEQKPKTMGPQELYALSQKTKGVVAKISPALNRAVPFHFKRKRVVNKLFFGALDPYPGAGNNPLFRKEILEKVKFRKLSERVWPSFMGRGADRDFNFQVAETFKNSRMFALPLYMWRTEKTQVNATPSTIDTYLSKL